MVVKKGASFNTRMGNINSAYALGYYAKAGTSPVVNAKNTSNADPQIAGGVQTNVTYRTHVQSYGWQAWKYNGQMSGTSGQAKRLEVSISVFLTSSTAETSCIQHMYRAMAGREMRTTSRHGGRMA